MSPRLDVSPVVALQDVPLRIRLTGLIPASTVLITAAMASRDGAAWRSRGRFRADGDGNVDLATAAPLDGTYGTASAMGLIWSMERETASSGAPPRRISDPVSIEFSASTPEGAAIASAVVERRIVAGDVSHRPLAPDGRLKGGWWLPAGAGPHPAIIVLGGSGGGADHGRAALYAAHGFAALALAYFGVPGLPRGLVNIPLEYVGAAIDHALDAMRPPKAFVALEGISRGGELALLAGATFPKVRAVVGVMASGLVMGAFGDPEPGDPHPTSAWTLGGKPVADLFEDNPSVDWSQARPETSMVPGYLAAMRDGAAVERATIQVERIQGPVLLVSGKDDRLAPRFELAEIARGRLQQHRHPWPYEHLSYEDTGHTIAPPYIPATVGSFVHPVSKEAMALGGTTVGRAHANEDWWPRALAFLQAAAS